MSLHPVLATPCRADAGKPEQARRVDGPCRKNDFPVRANDFDLTIAGHLVADRPSILDDHLAGKSIGQDCRFSARRIPQISARGTNPLAATGYVDVEKV